MLQVIRVTKPKDSAGSIYLEYSHSVSHTTSALIITITEPGINKDCYIVISNE